MGMGKGTGYIRGVDQENDGRFLFSCLGLGFPVSGAGHAWEREERGNGMRNRDVMEDDKVGFGITAVVCMLDCMSMMVRLWREGYHDMFLRSFQTHRCNQHGQGMSFP